MVTRCSCSSSDTRYPRAASLARVRIPTSARTASNRPTGCPPRFPISRLVSSPQRRAIQTAEPVADALGLPIDVDERLAEYDYGPSHYVPIEEAPGAPFQMVEYVSGHVIRHTSELAAPDFVTMVDDGVAPLIAAGLRALKNYRSAAL